MCTQKSKEKNLYESHAIGHSITPPTATTTIHSISKSSQKHKFYVHEARVKPYKWEYVWARAHTHKHARVCPMTLPYMADNNEPSRTLKECAHRVRMGAINFNSSAWTPYIWPVWFGLAWLAAFFTVLFHLLPLISKLHTCVLVRCAMHDCMQNRKIF